jgi:predicted ferric reductase
MVGLFGALIAGGLVASGGAALDALARWLGVESERLPWYAMRVLGLLGYAALAGSVVYGLLLSTHLLDVVAQRTNSFTLHQDLSSIGLGLAATHAALLMIDRSVPYSPLEILVPFGGPYRPVWIGVGQITIYLTALVVVSFHVRRRIGQQRWRTLHHLTFLVFAGATAHGLMAGTDSALWWVFWGYLLALAIVVFLTTYRVALSLIARRSSRPGAPARSGAAARSATTATDHSGGVSPAT